LVLSDIYFGYQGFSLTSHQGKRVQVPDTSLEAQKYANLENLVSSGSDYIKKVLKTLAESGDEISTTWKKSVLKQLNSFSPNGADTSQAMVADRGGESQPPIDFREAIVALHDALSRHKQCHDISSDTTEPLVTQMWLSEARRNNTVEFRISLLVLVHRHTRPYETGLKRCWRHVEIDVYRRR
jgi:hypothetical protein